MKKFLLLLALMTHSLFVYAHDTGHRHHHRAKAHPQKVQKIKKVKSTKVVRTKKSKVAKVRNLRHQGLPAVTAADFDPVTGDPKLASNIALIYDQQSQRTIFSKNPDIRAPIASITKLMTAIVVLDAKQSLNEMITISDADVDYLKGTHSRLTVGTTLSRAEMLNLALMSSENRAASALARTYPGGLSAAIQAMNAKATQLGMTNTRFYDGTGLNSSNTSTATDLVKMVAAATNYPVIHQFSTAPERSVWTSSGREMQFRNTNPLVKNDDWEIGVSKTGFINEAGRCLVMEATIQKRPVIIVLLDSVGKFTRIGDANRIKKWMERGGVARATSASVQPRA